MPADAIMLLVVIYLATAYAAFRLTALLDSVLERILAVVIAPAICFWEVVGFLVNWRLEGWGVAVENIQLAWNDGYANDH